MSLMYFFLVPLFGKVFYERVGMIKRSVKCKDVGAIKANVLFLILLVGAGLVLLIQRKEF